MNIFRILLILLSLSSNYAWAQEASIPPVLVRERLTAARQYWVAASGGSDSNDGRTGATAFATIQKAIDTIWNTLDTNGKGVTIQLFGSGVTYNGGITVSGPVPGGGNININGNTGSPQTIVWQSSNTHLVNAQYGSRINVQGMELRTSGSGAALNAQFGSLISFNNVRFGSCAASHLDASQSASIVAAGPYSIVAGAVSHIHAHAIGNILLNGQTITIANTPAFSAYFLGNGGGYVEAIGTSFTGTGATGTRFVIHYAGSVRLDTENLNFWPGSVDGYLSKNGVLDNHGGATVFRKSLLGQTSNTTIVVPAYFMINDLVLNNPGTNAVTGGIQIGTTPGGSDVLAATSLAAGEIKAIGQASLLKRIFSISADTTLYISAGTSWNGAAVDVSLIGTKTADLGHNL